MKPLSLGSDDVVCIAALPPFAFTHARTACQRVRAAAPDVKIIVGIWGFSSDTAKARERFGHARPDALLTTLAGTLEQIAVWEGRRAAGRSGPGGDRRSGFGNKVDGLNHGIESRVRRFASAVDDGDCRSDSCGCLSR